MSASSIQYTDLLLVEDDQAEWDLDVQNQDLALDDTIEMACIVSIFTDQRVTSDELPLLQTDLRGWWGDVVNPNQTDQTGSKLWLLERANPTQDTLSRAQQYVQDCLQWMIDDGVAQSVSVTCSFPTTQFLLIQVTIVEPDGSVTPFEFEYAWGQTLQAVS